MDNIEKHKYICTNCVSTKGIEYKYNIFNKHNLNVITTITINCCMLWNKEKAYHMYKKKSRYHPMVTSKYTIPKKCLYMLEHILID